METIAVKDLKRDLSAVLRKVREKRESITITSNGVPVARLVPWEDDDALWAELDELAEEIGRRWPEGVSAAEAVSRERR